MPMNLLAGTAHHKRRQLRALLLLVIACCVMVICLTQRASVLHQMQARAAAYTAQVAAPGEQTLAPPSLSPCELSAHSVLAAQPLHFDTVLLLPTLLVLMLAAQVIIPVPQRPDAVPRPPLLRIHLTNCVFRE